MKTTWDELREKRQVLMEDLNACITYTPNWEADLIAFMSQYIKANADIRPQLLVWLRACMDGREYPNPYEMYTQPTAADVEQFGLILDGFLDSLSSISTEAQPDRITTSVEETVRKLNLLNEHTGLIDSWRRDKLCEIINQAADMAGVHLNKDIIYCLRSW